jgi:hypothetical protein
MRRQQQARPHALDLADVRPLGLAPGVLDLPRDRGVDVVLGDLLASDV